MMHLTIIITHFLLSSINAFDFGNSTFSAGSIVLDKADDVEAICAARKCIRKCCPKDQYYSIASYTCERFEGKLDFTNISVYDDYDHLLKINKTLSDIFLLVPGKFFEVLKDKSDYTETFSDEAFVISDYDFSTYLTESGKLFMEIPNSYNRWILIDDFCIDYEIGNNTTPKYWSTFVHEIRKNNDFHTVALLVSSMFLFIVLIVYILLPDLRNLAGKVLMAYVLSLMSAFFSMAYIQLTEFDYYECIKITAVIYFSLLAAFCWMNVMSFDIWWTFRSYPKVRPFHRRGETLKFAMFCLYAWGIPLLMAVALVVINDADLSHMPWIIKPQIPSEGCFLEGGQRLLYMYVPMLILIVCNWMFFLMTVFNVSRLSRGTSVLKSIDSPAFLHRQSNRISVYLKLSVVMGINWILDVISFLTPDLDIWRYMNTYNFLVGLPIFFIFVCKKKIYRKFQNRYCGCLNIKPINESRNILKPNPSQDILLQVSTHIKESDERIDTI